MKPKQTGTSMYQALLGDPELARLMGEQHQIDQMIRIEGQLALAQAEVGLIPRDAAEGIKRACLGMNLTPADLAPGMAQDGIPVPALLSRLKQQLLDKHADWVHYGATSQDIVDTATVLCLQEALEIFEQRLDSIIGQLATLVENNRNVLVAGRTRSQQGAPINLGLKITQWLKPLLHQRAQLAHLKPELLRLQLAGAVGNLSAMGEQAEDVIQTLASRLNLTYRGGWHTQRGPLMELGSWLSITTTSLGKMARDWTRMAQTEVGEIRFADGGGSSTLPHKSNPVKAEIIQSLAMQTTGLSGQLLYTNLSEHERDGVAWSQEWLILPPLVEAAGAALKRTEEALNALELDHARMQQNLWQTGGLLFSEALTFALGRQTSREQAKTLVKQAVQDTLADRETQQTLVDRVNQAAGTRFVVADLEAALLHAGTTDNEIERTLNSL